MLNFLALKALPWRLIGWCALGLAFVGMLTALRLTQAQNGKLKAQLHECTIGRQSDRISYEQAQKTAEALNRAQVERVKSQQQRITDDVEANLSARLERLRRELRSNTAPQSAPVSPNPSLTGPASEGPAPTARLCLSTEELLRAAENEERHDQLINWVLGQSQVDPNK
jgi:hypothetical protein